MFARHVFMMDCSDRERIKQVGIVSVSELEAVFV